MSRYEIEQILRLPGQNVVDSHALAGATTLRLTSILDAGLAGRAWVVTNPYSANCEIRKITAIANRDATLDAAIANAVRPGSPVLIQAELIFNVMFFGAAGDGVTDDTTAIQAALEAANTAGGGTVYMPEGTFISDPLIISSNVHLIGTGKGKTILKYKAGVGDAWLIRDALAGGNTNISLRDLTIDGNKTNRGASINGAAYFADVDGLIVENVHCQNFTYYDIYCLGAKNFVIDHFSSEGTGVCSVWTGKNARGGRISNCYVKNLIGGKVGYYFGNSYRITGQDISLSNCIANGCGDSGFMVGWDDFDVATRAQRITISNCSAIDMRDFGFYVGYGEQITITGCTARTAQDNGTQRAGQTGGGFGAGGLIVKGLTISGCIAHTCGYAGIFLATDQVAGSICEDITISGNVCYNNDQNGADHAGITLDSSVNLRRAVVQGNVCFDDQVAPTQDYGIKVTGTHTGDLLISGNICYHHPKVGISLAGVEAGTTAVVVGNSCLGNTLGSFDSLPALSMVGMNYCGDPSTLANVYALQMLTSPLTSTSYDGDAVVQGTTTIDTSAVFSLPANVKAVYVWLGAKWAAASESSYAALRPTGNANAQVSVRSMVAGALNDDHGIVKCDANGDFDLTVGGADTTALHLQILGYFI